MVRAGRETMRRKCLQSAVRSGGKAKSKSVKQRNNVELLLTLNKIRCTNVFAQHIRG